MAVAEPKEPVSATRTRVEYGPAAIAARARAIAEDRLSPHHRGLIRRLSGCMIVSIIVTVGSFSALALFILATPLEPWIANFIITALAIPVSYYLNRRWVWRRTHAHDPLREFLPFWVMSFVGLILSTIVVAYANKWAKRQQLGAGTRTLVILGSLIVVSGVLWVVQFAIIDRVLFKALPHPLVAED
jgi:putative flippase GtrA